MVEIFPFVVGKEIWVRWKNLRTCFKRELDAPKNETPGEGRTKVINISTLTNCYSFYITLKTVKRKVN